MKKIFFLSTGGTIASSKGEEGFTPTLNAEDMMKSIPELSKLCKIKSKMIMNIDSCNMQPEDWMIIAENIFEVMEDYDGIVIAHGTGTMAYTSSALSFMLQNINKPVVITGSQMPIGAKGTDAKKNLMDAFIVACEDIAGIFIVFDGKIIRGCRASKLRTKSFNAFESINYPYIGMINNKSIEYIYKPHFKTKERIPKLITAYSPNVILLKLIPGINSKIFNALMALNYKGVIIESFGGGGLPFKRHNLIPKVQEMVERGMSVVVTTQCLYEGTHFEKYEVGQKILKTGIIPAYDMTTESLVTKLMWALGQTDNPEKIKKIMAYNYADEVKIKLGLLELLDKKKKIIPNYIVEQNHVPIRNSHELKQ